MGQKASVILGWFKGFRAYKLGTNMKWGSLWVQRAKGGGVGPTVESCGTHRSVTDGYEAAAAAAWMQPCCWLWGAVGPTKKFTKIQWWMIPEDELVENNMWKFQSLNQHTKITNIPGTFWKKLKTKQFWLFTKTRNFDFIEFLMPPNDWLWSNKV